MRKLLKIGGWILSSPVVFLLSIAMLYTLLVDVFFIFRGFKYLKSLVKQQLKMIFGGILDL